MKVLVVGGGGREHAIVQKLKESKEITALYCAPGNGGIARDAVCVPIKATDVEAIADWAAAEKMDYVVVTPDDPLCLGLVDLLAARGIPAFGPDKAAARIEGSKVFAKDLMRRYGDALVRMCCLYLNDASLAQDAAQDTFIKAWRNLGQFRGECDERTWLMRIAINTCRDYHRTAWLRHVDRGTPLEALPEVGAEDTHPDGEVIRAVMALPLREREAVLLRYYQEMTIAEAAQALRISQSAVKQRLRRANRRLRDRLKEWYYDA